MTRVSSGKVSRTWYLAIRIATCLLLVGAAAGADGDTMTVSLDAIPDASGLYWQDITGPDYSQQFQDSFRYSDSRVSLSYSTYDLLYFTGILTAADLKPNFCYQMKLNGKPEGYWDSSGDDQANENIGYTGRWWRNEPNPGNSTDSDYSAHKDDPTYVYTGYLLYDYFVTDEAGAADVSFVSDNAYHVV